MNKKLIIIAVLLATVIISGVKLDSYAEQSFSERHSLNSSSALLDILGEVRYTAAAVLWMKTDYYQHEYEHEGKTLAENSAIMPLIRLITLLDPHFVQAYDFGAYHLAVNLKKHKESIAFLEEGLANNPNSFDLNWEYGFLMYKDKSYERALPYLLKAREFRSAKTPVYSEWIKMVWVNTRIADCLKKTGKAKEAVFYEKELKDFTTKYDKEHPEEKNQSGHMEIEHIDED